MWSRYILHTSTYSVDVTVFVCLRLCHHSPVGTNMKTKSVIGIRSFVGVMAFGWWHPKSQRCQVMWNLFLCMSYFRQCPFKFRLNMHILSNKNIASDVIVKCKAWVVELFVETTEVVWSRMISASGPISWILSKEGFDGEGVWGKVRVYGSGSVCRERTICLQKKMKSIEVGQNKRNSCSESESEHTTVDGKKSCTSRQLLVDIPIFIGFYTSQVVGLGISEPSTVTQQEQLNPVTPPTSTMFSRGHQRRSHAMKPWDALGRKGMETQMVCWVSPDFFFVRVIH